MNISVATAHSARQGNERLLRGWARAGGLVFAFATLLSMAYSEDWKFAVMATDPLVWMMTLLALAAGVVSGYACGLRVHARIVV